MAAKRSGLNSIFGKTKEEKIIEKNIDESRATFQVNNEILEKIRAISYWERKLLKDITNEAFSDYISKYENKNGEIKLPPLQK